MAEILLGLGANLGDAAESLDEACKRLAQDPRLEWVSRSKTWQTAAVGPSEREFLNAAACLRSELPPMGVLQVLLETEETMGRVRRERWGARRIDIDLLLYDEKAFFSSRLQVPHSWLLVRRFSLGPAAEIAPQWQHPIAKRSLKELALSHQQPVICLVGGNQRQRVQAARFAKKQALPTGLSASPTFRLQVVDDPSPELPWQQQCAKRNAAVKHALQDVSNNAHHRSSPSLPTRYIAPFYVNAPEVAAIIVIDDLEAIYASTASPMSEFIRTQGKPFVVVPSDSEMSVEVTAGQTALFACQSMLA